MKSDTVVKLTIEIEKPTGKLLERVSLAEQKVEETKADRKTAYETRVKHVARCEKLVNSGVWLRLAQCISEIIDECANDLRVGTCDRFHDEYSTRISTRGWKPATAKDCNMVVGKCVERGMNVEDAEHFVRWHAARKWRDAENAKVCDLIETWIRRA